MIKVLIIEDDIVIATMLGLYLTGEGFTVYQVETAQAGYNALTDFNPDVILLDLVLPDSNGTDTCDKFRKLTNTPILIVSMKNEIIDRLNAFSSGADDFLSKPFSFQELKARIEVVLRRVEPRLHSAIIPKAANPNKFYFDYERRLIIVSGTKVETTYSEWELMKLFYSFPEQVFLREDLINAIRGVDTFVNDRAIDVHIMNLRKKIEVNPKQPRHIKTVWKIGYKFVLE